jgi:DNA-binding SARP family transcriptional activator
MTGLCVNVLGPVRAWRSGREIDLGTARRRALFAVLAANANRVVSRDELIVALWGDFPPSTAAGNVYTYVSGLRRSLEPHREPGRNDGPLVSRAAGYTLRLAADAVDADRFRHLCESATASAAAGRPNEAVAVLDEALALWQGDAYANLTGRFVELDRYRLEKLRTAAAEQRARFILAAGGDDGLIADLTTLVRRYPLHEPFHELLMAALHQGGRATEALEAFRAARQTLADELGVEPGPTIRALQRRILAKSDEPPTTPRIPPPTSPSAPPTARRPGPSLIGRDTEVRLMLHLAGRVAGGHGTALWIEGEPGIGKSELMAVVLNEAERIGCRIARGVADELSRRVPLRAVMRTLNLETTATDPHRAALAGALPGDPRGVELVVGYVRDLCATGPLAVALDDMQWIDEIGLLVWERLIELTRSLPLLLVSAARTEPNGRGSARLRDRVVAHDGHLLALGPLNRRDIERVVAAVAGAPPGPALRSLAELTGGNPLYARELVHGLMQQEAVRVADGYAEVEPHVSEVPRSLLDIVQETLADLHPDRWETLRHAALLGAEFTVADVAAFTGRPSSAVGADLREADVVVDIGGALRFRHPVLRQALVGSVPAALRPPLHRHAAEVLAANGGPAGRVAEHLVLGTPEVDAWMVGWVAAHGAELVRESPGPAGDLIGRVLADGRCTTSQRESLESALSGLASGRAGAPRSSPPGGAI